MAKDKSKKKNKNKELETAHIDVAAVAEQVPGEPRPNMSRKEFDKEMEKLQVELVKLQEWVKASGEPQQT